MTFYQHDFISNNPAFSDFDIKLLTMVFKTWGFDIGFDKNSVQRLLTKNSLLSCSRWSVRRILRKAEEAGVIAVESRGSGRRPNRFKFVKPNGLESQELEELRQEVPAIVSSILTGSQKTPLRPSKLPHKPDVQLTVQVLQEKARTLECKIRRDQESLEQVNRSIQLFLEPLGEP
jgi:MarR-like DNA-binding transcriptional regulator SgrR of sgrS sRNA